MVKTKTKPKIKLLVVDDNEDVCRFVEQIFTKRGLSVYFALNGEEAIKIVIQERPQVILLDIQMPVLDGIETLKKIKQLDTKVVCIMVTQVDEQARIDEAYSLGAKEYITKPLILEDLIKSVEKAIKKFQKGKNDK